MSWANVDGSLEGGNGQGQAVQEFFDRNVNWKGEVYRNDSDVHARGVQRRVRYVMRMLGNLDKPLRGIVLDVGCGPGVYLKELIKRGCQCIGIDISPEMLRVCDQHLHNEALRDTKLLCGNVENLPVDSDIVDLLLCIGVLQYAESLERALTEIDRVTRRGAFVVICFENLMSLSNLDWVMRQKIKSLVRKRAMDNSISMVSDWFLSNPENSHCYRLYNPWKFEYLMRSIGFRVVDTMTYGYEFRFVRKLHILPETAWDSFELFLERLCTRVRLPYLCRSGKFYIGVYEKAGTITKGWNGIWSAMQHA